MKRKTFSRTQIACMSLSAVALAVLAACGGGSDADSAQALAAPDGTAQILALGAADGSNAAATAEASVVALTKIGETRVNRTVYDYVYRVTVRNGTQPQTDVTATLTGVGAGTTIVDGTAQIGNVAASGAAMSSDTITVRHDRTLPFDTQALRWKVAGAYTDAPSAIRMTWFGITNWHYQVGNVGIMLDGETLNGASSPTSAVSVAKAIGALQRTGSIDVILVGHDHGDHSRQIPEWAKQTGKPVYAPKTVCTTLIARGLPASQCTPLLGGEAINLNDFVTVRVVRWVHSVDCDEQSNGTGGPETFGFLITSKSSTKDKLLNVYVSDSGAGGADLTIPRVANGITYGSPLANLRAAVNAAGLSKLDVWQGGPESRMVNQARIIVPEIGVQTFMPHHLNSRASNTSRFNLTYGMHYAYNEADQPKLQAYLASVGVPQVYPTNYFDAWTYGASGVVKTENTAMKADYGLPADGPGPGAQGPNPRAGELECPLD